MLAFAFSSQAGAVVFRKLSFAALSASIASPIYSCALCLVEISGIGTLSVYPCFASTLEIAKRACMALSNP